MTWLQPWAVWFLAGLPVIVLLYLLKVRRQPARVSTLIFWRRVVQENRRRALFQRLRSVLSLLLHLLIFALIVAALARPTFDRMRRDGSSTVVIIDVRLRMQALEPDGESRFAQALRRALATIRDASPGRQFALITAGPSASVVVPFSDNERVLRTAVEKLQATDAGGALDPALDLAETLIAARRGPGQIVLFTDQPLPPAMSARHPALVVHALGTPRENAAITRFAARAVPSSPSTSEVLIEARNFGDQPLQTNLEFRYDDRLLDVKPLTLAPNGRELLVFPSVPRPAATARGHFTATLDAKDALAADNVARVWLPPPRPVRVLLISAGNAFLEKALAADPGVSFEFLAPDAWTEALGAKFDVVVFDGFVPPGAPAVSSLYVKKSPFDLPGQPLELPALTEIDSEHPTLRLLDFSQTTILRAQPLALPPPTTDWSYAAPLRSFDHALLITGERRGGKPPRVAALGIDLTASDLPLRVAFPLLITNTVHWLAGVATQPPNAIRAGEQGLLHNGFFPTMHDGRSGWLAVNSFDETESNLRFAPAAGSQPEHTSHPTWASLGSWPLWRYLAFAALTLFTLEWSLFHRRRTE